MWLKRKWYKWNNGEKKGEIENAIIQHPFGAFDYPEFKY